jgi:hypothetical protein
MGWLDDITDAIIGGVTAPFNAAYDTIKDGAESAFKTPNPQVPPAFQAPVTSKTASQLGVNQAALGKRTTLMDFYIPLTKGPKMP